MRLPTAGARSASMSTPASDRRAIHPVVGSGSPSTSNDTGTGTATSGLLTYRSRIGFFRLTVTRTQPSVRPRLGSRSRIGRWGRVWSKVQSATPDRLAVEVEQHREQLIGITRIDSIACSPMRGHRTHEPHDLKPRDLHRSPSPVLKRDGADT